MLLQQHDSNCGTCARQPTDGLDSFRGGLRGCIPFMGGRELLLFCGGNCRSTRPPPQGHEDGQLPEGAAGSGAGGNTVMDPSSRWAIFFSPGANSEGTSPEMKQDNTEFCVTIASESTAAEVKFVMNCIVLMFSG